MKIIVSHDVDHLFIKEHFKDTFVPGVFKRGLQSLLYGDISFSIFLKRFTTQLNRVKEVHLYNKGLGIRETFFFGMRKGLNLSYNWENTKPLIDYLVSEDVLVGLHGQGYDNEQLLQEEKSRISSMLPDGYPLGIRNHYLRKNDQTFTIMDKTGFLYDSTEYSIMNPHRYGQMWEIPISVMDAGFVAHHKNDRSALKEKTLKLIESAESAGIPFFVINFHDLLFGEGYPDFRFWYIWLTGYLHEKNYTFVNFNDALKTLNSPL